MFEEPSQPVQIGKERAKKAQLLTDYSLLSDEELIRHYDAIKKHLPSTSLKDVNLEEELLLQFHTLRKLQSDVLGDEEFPLNQRAQVANTVGATLDRLVEAQEKVYSQERFKALENLLVRHIRKLPEEVAEAWLNDYETLIKAPEVT
jgi:hypothetical protein